jgi:hypothetical protein
MIDPKNLREVASVMKDYGIYIVKSNGMEIHMATDEMSDKVPFPHAAEKPVTPEEEKEIKHKVDEFTSLLKLDDVGLLDRLFPAEEDKKEVG